MSGIRYDLLSKDEIEFIHRKGLQLLEKVGFKIDHPEAEALLSQVGVIRNGRAYLSADQVQSLIDENDVNDFWLYNRNGDRAIHVKNGQSFFGPGSDALYQIDPHSGEKRLTSLEDIANNVRLADYLPEYDFIMSMGVPQKLVGKKVFPIKNLYANVFAQMVKNTTKPMVTTLTSLDDIKEIHHIASIVAGGKDRFKENPFFIAYLEPISPLIIDREGANRILYCAENGIPFVFAAGANLGSGAPINKVWGVLQGHAESLFGFVLAKLKNGDTKFVYGANTSAADMRTYQVAYGAPEWFTTVTMYAELGKYLNLPSWGTSGSSDAFHLDAQFGSAAMEGIVKALISASTLIHDNGYAAHGELNIPAAHVFVNDLIARVKRGGGRETITELFLDKGIEVIEEVSTTDIDFVSHETTLAGCRTEVWNAPKEWERGVIEDFPGHDIEDLYTLKAQEILESHRPEVLDSVKSEQIDAYLSSGASKR